MANFGCFFPLPVLYWRWSFKNIRLKEELWYEKKYEDGEFCQLNIGHGNAVFEVPVWILSMEDTSYWCVFFVRKEGKGKVVRLWEKKESEEWKQIIFMEKETGKN